MPELLEMKDCPQPPNFHSEGDVWTHTKLALKNLFSPEFKQQFGKRPPSIELIMAVLFHDIGKFFQRSKKILSRRGRQFYFYRKNYI